MLIRLFGIAQDSIVDGPGIRFTIFTQGCIHKCPGCHNPNSHPMDGGFEMDTDELISKFSGNPLLKGITLSGGEPFLQPSACSLLAEAAKKIGLSVWAYSGYTFNELIGGAEPERLKLLRLLDVLVDGRFIKELHHYKLRFRGSSNQRLIDVQRSLASGCDIEYQLD